MRSFYYLCIVNRSDFIEDFSRLGAQLRSYLLGEKALFDLDNAIRRSVEANPWFTPYHIREMLRAISHDFLQREKLTRWLKSYPDIWYHYQKEITVVMAGNIPLVGYHDYLCVLASGRKISIKLSSKDSFLLPALHELLCSFSPEWRGMVRYVQEVPEDTDGIIATGTDSTAAHFADGFAFLPKIIRGHSVSLAVIPKEITQEQISHLQRDMFLYFGLGCRSVTHLFIPQEFDIKRITAFDQWPQEASHSGFYHAFLRQRALLTLQQISFTDGGFFILQPSEELSPPLSTFFYTRYTHINEVKSYIQANCLKIQCVVGMGTDIKKSINFGSAQNPQLWDYANGIDTMNL